MFSVSIFHILKEQINETHHISSYFIEKTPISYLRNNSYFFHFEILAFSKDSGITGVMEDDIVHVCTQG